MINNKQFSINKTHFAGLIALALLLCAISFGAGTKYSEMDCAGNLGDRSFGEFISVLPVLLSMEHGDVVSAKLLLITELDGVLINMEKYGTPEMDAFDKHNSKAKLIRKYAEIRKKQKNLPEYPDGGRLENKISAVFSKYQDGAQKN